MGPSVLYTENLILKVENESKAGAVLDLYKRNSIIFEKFEPTRPAGFYTKDYHISHLRSEYNAYLGGNFLRYYIYTANRTDRIIGSVNFNIKKGTNGIYSEIGYKLDLLYQGRGFAYEACYNGIVVMQKHYGITMIAAHIAPDNEPSIRLAGKLGFIKIKSNEMCANVNGRDIYLDLYALDTSDIQ
ncbi:MAG: GNAT family N-acetyltransferase [Lachnospiraceae bacterium]|nr:GNAT family N-acetyltransferase [Lachnospiraceae bacterium]